MAIKSRRKTKIIATLGPASSSKEQIEKLIHAGVNVFRLNFSHGSHEAHLALLETVRKVSAEIDIPVAILQDLSGPKIRISKIDGDYVTIADNDSVSLVLANGSFSNSQTIYVEGIDPAQILKQGQSVLLADGSIVLEVTELQGNTVVCRVEKGGRVRSRVGIAFPDSTINLPATTDKDLVDLRWGIEHGVDYVAISFVQNGQDIRRLKDFIATCGGNVPIIAKIERRAALDNLEEIMQYTDALMVARGDLGLELPVEQVPRAQHTIITKANARGLPVIVATQMLHSMITSVRPTRAEVSDIATAVMTGADAVMLSDETAIGEHPVECVKYLGRIALEAEKTFDFEEYKLRLRESDQSLVPDAVAYAACAAAVKVRASAVIACTETGLSARLVAKYRPNQPLYATSRREDTLRRMCLYWGVTPIPCLRANTHEDEIDRALHLVQQLEGLASDQRAVVTGGLLVNTPGATSVLEVREFRSRE